MITRRSSLADVAVAVGHALRSSGIRAVLTGGACAELYAPGAPASFDVDFILGATVRTEDLNRALEALGFVRRGDRYTHTKTPFHVEFPAGPLAIGQDTQITPTIRTRRGARTLALSATDACRDRLAAFYFWSDRQSLAAAVAIARETRVSLAKIRAWSDAEGHRKGYETFLRERRRAS